MVKFLVVINGVADITKGGFSALIANWSDELGSLNGSYSQGLIHRLLKKKLPLSKVTFLFGLDFSRIPFFLRFITHAIDGLCLSFTNRIYGYKKICFVVGTSYMPLVIAFFFIKEKKSISIYFVDDIDFMLDLNKKNIEKHIFNFLLEFLCSRGVKFVAISEGLSKRISQLHKVKVETVLLPYVFGRSIQMEFKLQTEKCISKQILFLGSVNEIILDSLQDFIKRIPKDWSLLIATASHNKALDEFCSKNRNNISIFFDIDDLQAFDFAKSSRAILVPYSFNDKYRIMVETSFPSKILKAVTFNKPIILFGPCYQVLYSVSYKNELIFFDKEFNETDLSLLPSGHVSYQNLKKSHSVHNFLSII